MYKLKVCMLGAFAVGKTSLVQRYVNSIFDEKYKATLGVKIDKKEFQLDGQGVQLILWDLAGEDEFVKLRTAYLRGSNAYFLVVDGTRPETLRTAMDLHQKAVAELGDVPFVLLVNKSDLKDDWAVEESELSTLTRLGWDVVEVSAKQGDNVEKAFELVCHRVMNQDD